MHCNYWTNDTAGHRKAAYKGYRKKGYYTDDNLFDLAEEQGWKTDGGWRVLGDVEGTWFWALDGRITGKGVHGVKIDTKSMQRVIDLTYLVYIDDDVILVPYYISNVAGFSRWYNGLIRRYAEINKDRKLGDAIAKLKQDVRYKRALRKITFMYLRAGGTDMSVLIVPLRTVKSNAYFNDTVGHSKAAKKGWKKRRLTLLRPYITYLKRQIEEAEAGTRGFLDKAGVFVYAPRQSTFPQWASGMGWSKDGILKVFDKMEKKESIPKSHSRQLAILDTILDEADYLQRLDSYEDARQRKTAKTITQKVRLEADELVRGQKVKINRKSWVVTQEAGPMKELMLQAGNEKKSFGPFEDVLIDL